MHCYDTVFGHLRWAEHSRDQNKICGIVNQSYEGCRGAVFRRTGFNREEAEMANEPSFVELRDLMRSTADMIEDASSIDQMKLAMVPAFRLLSDRYEERAFDSGELKRP